MFTHSLTTRGGEFEYSAPTIETLDIRVEQGFAASSNGILDYSPEGDAGLTGEDSNDMGTL